MRIEHIEIENFRNIEKMSLDFDLVNIIYGENANGKTNLIEALYLFTGLKSFRGTKDADLIMFNKDFSRLKINFFAGKRKQNAELIIKEKKKAFLNGIQKDSAVALGEEIKAIIFSPSHLSMIKDGPEQRRKFIDRALCQIKNNYKAVLNEYKRCLMQRNVLLRDMRKSPELQDMLFIWDRNFAKTASKIIYQRCKYIKKNEPIAEKIFSGLSGGKECLTLKMKGAFDYDDFETDEIYKKVLAELEKNRTDDILNGTTSVGPHRDDMEILINGKSARIFGSQGQQRSCVIALKLAESELLRERTGIEPVVLLDDVMSELDEKRQDYILNHIKSGQMFITCCDKNTVLKLKAGKTFLIENGKATGD